MSARPEYAESVRESAIGATKTKYVLVCAVHLDADNGANKLGHVCVEVVSVHFVLALVEVGIAREQCVFDIFDRLHM